MKNSNLEITGKLLADFVHFFSKRSSVFLSSSRTFLPIFFEWHLLIWRKEKQYLTNDMLGIGSQYVDLAYQLETLFEEICKRVLKERRSI
jgi:hypothetical protein